MGLVNKVMSKLVRLDEDAHKLLTSMAKDKDTPMSHLLSDIIKKNWEKHYKD